MTYSCAIFSRGATTLEEAQETKLELVCQKLALHARPARARRRLRLGLVRDPRRPAPRRARHRHHALAAAGRDRAAARRGGGRRRPHRLPRRRLPRARAASRSTPSPRSAWSSTSAPSRWTSTRAGCAARCARAGGCSTTASPTCARRTRGRATSPRATSSPTARRCRCRACCSALERAGLETAPHRGLPRRLRRDAAALGAPARREPRRGDAAGGRRARARLAALPAGGAQRLRDRLHLDLPGPRVVIGEALVRVRRGAGVESEHRVAWATTDRGRGGRAHAAGAARPPIPARRSTRARRPSRSRRWPACAPACPSASGSAPSTSRWRARRTAAATTHVARVREILAAAGRSEDDLACGAAEPRDPARRRARGRRAAASVRHNCSGKHAFGLALAAAEGWPAGGLHRQGPSAAGRDGGRHGRGDARRARGADARHRRLRDADVLGPDRAAGGGVRPARRRAASGRRASGWRRR